MNKIIANLSLSLRRNCFFLLLTVFLISPCFALNRATTDSGGRIERNFGLPAPTMHYDCVRFIQPGTLSGSLPTELNPEGYYFGQGVLGTIGSTIIGGSVLLKKPSLTEINLCNIDLGIPDEGISNGFSGRDISNDCFIPTNSKQFRMMIWAPNEVISCAITFT